MKKHILIPAAILVASWAQAQSATPSPTPFDQLRVVPVVTGTSAPAATPTAAQLLARQQGLFLATVRQKSQIIYKTTAAEYLDLYNYLTTDDSAGGNALESLTPGQKAAALSYPQWVEILWEAQSFANALNGIHAGTVPNPAATPPIAAPSPSPSPGR